MRLTRTIGIIALILAIFSTAVISTSFACPNDESNSSDTTKDGK